MVITIKALADMISLRQINNYNMHTNTKRKQGCTKIFSVSWYINFTKAFFVFKTSQNLTLHAELYVCVNL